MTINFTLIIQMIHFFIGYLIIKNILLKPALSKIQSEERLQEELNNSINFELLNIEKKENDKILLWEKISYKIIALKPDLDKIYQKVFIGRIHKIPEISKEVSDRLKNELTNLIVNKVKNVK